MIVSIAGITEKGPTLGDLSGRVDRQAGGSIEATLGNRMDVLTLTLMDFMPPQLAIPDRGEIVIYDAAPGAAVTDPPNAISAWNTYLNGAGHEVTSNTPSQWTARLFAGYIAKPIYSLDGAQRYVQVTAQDYTYRLRTTIANTSFQAGQTDQAIIQSLFTRYRPDIDTSNVQVVTSNFPAISFPAHSLEQFLQRIVKVSRASYRVDYYKRLFYGVLGFLIAPINFSDHPDFSSTFPVEGLTYEPDGTGLVDKVWVIGGSFLSGQQAYQIPVTLVNGSNYQFPLPGDPDTTGLTVTVGGTDQGTVGVAPGAGDPTSQASFKNNALVQHTPPVVMLKTTPPNGTTVIVTAKFKFPLIQTVSDPALIAAMNGLIFERVIRDKRINDLTLAQQVGTAFLKSQGQTLKGGQFLSKWRASPSTGALLTPGQQATIRNDIIYAGLLPGGSTTNTIIITKMLTKLSEDINQPWEVEVNYADRSVAGGY